MLWFEVFVIRHIVGGDGGEGGAWGVGHCDGNTMGLGEWRVYIYGNRWIVYRAVNGSQL